MYRPICCHPVCWQIFWSWKCIRLGTEMVFLLFRLTLFLLIWYIYNRIFNFIVRYRVYYPSLSEVHLPNLLPKNEIFNKSEDAMYQKLANWSMCYLPGLVIRAPGKTLKIFSAHSILFLRREWRWGFSQHGEARKKFLRGWPSSVLTPSYQFFFFTKSAKNCIYI